MLNEEQDGNCVYMFMKLYNLLGSWLPGGHCGKGGLDPLVILFFLSVNTDLVRLTSHQ